MNKQSKSQFYYSKSDTYLCQVFFLYEYRFYPVTFVIVETKMLFMKMILNIQTKNLFSYLFKKIIQFSLNK